MAQQLESIPDLDSIGTHAQMLLAKPGRHVWMAVDGRLSNPFLTPFTVKLLERWLLDDHHTSVQILTTFDHGVVRAVPQLRALAEHLPSRITMRTLDPKAESFSGDYRIQGEWLLTRAGGVLHRHSVENDDWSGALYAPGAMRKLQRTHALLWEHALPSTELRSMPI